MEMPEPPRADAMSRRRAADHESGWEAGSRTWSQTGQQTGALQGGRAGDQRRQGGSRVWRLRAPLPSPGLGRARPRPQRPTSGCRECPAVPGDPTRGGKVKSGRSTAFFKHTSRRCRSRKTKLSHLGERWKNTQRAWSPPPRARAGAAGPRPAASPPPGFPTPGPRPSDSLRPSLAHPGRHSREGQGHSCPEPGRPVSGSMSAAIKVWASVSPSARRRVCSLSRS